MMPHILLILLPLTGAIRSDDTPDSPLGWENNCKTTGQQRGHQLPRLRGQHHARDGCEVDADQLPLGGRAHQGPAALDDHPGLRPDGVHLVGSGPDRHPIPCTVRGLQVCLAGIYSSLGFWLPDSGPPCSAVLVRGDLPCLPCVPCTVLSALVVPFVLIGVPSCGTTPAVSATRCRHALQGFVDSLRSEIASAGISVTCMFPRFTVPTCPVHV